MQRREIIRLFREICECIPDSFVSSVSLIPTHFLKGDFKLKIDVDLTQKSLQTVESIVNKHGLFLKEEPGSLLIYESVPQQKKIEIIA